MTVVIQEQVAGGPELTNHQLLERLFEFYNFEPSSLGFDKEDFFSHLETTDITFLIATSIQRLSPEGKNAVSRQWQNSSFSAKLTPIYNLNNLLSERGFRFDAEQAAPAAVITMVYTDRRQRQDGPEFMTVLPIDSGLSFDRGRCTTVTYLNKWRKPTTVAMQAGLQCEDSEKGPQESANTLRRAVGFLIEALKEDEVARSREIGEAAKKWRAELHRLGQIQDVAAWWINIAMSGLVPSASRMVNSSTRKPTDRSN